MCTEAMQQRIAARKAMGMTAEEYDLYLERKAQEVNYLKRLSTYNAMADSIRQSLPNNPMLRQELLKDLAKQLRVRY